MKRFALVLVLAAALPLSWAAVMIPPLLISSCSTARVQDETLLPAMRAAWPSIHAAAERGGTHISVLDAFSEALRTGDRTSLAALPWADVAASATAGIEARVTAGEITPGVAASLHERVRMFALALSNYVGS